MLGKTQEATELQRGMRHAVSFMRKASTEMRQIAEAAPDIAAELLHVARQLEAEADDLARRHTG